MSAHTYLCPLRWGDMDALGHVNNSLFVDYLQEARVDFLLAGPPEMAELLETGVLVVSHHVEYQRPVVFDLEPLEITLWVASVGGARFSIAYEVRHRGEQVARALTVATPYDLAEGRLRRLTGTERAGLEAGRSETEALAPKPRARGTEAGHAYPLVVRWSDLDSYGHANNVKFYDYIQEARIAMIARAWDPAEGGFVLVRQDLDYLRPLDHRREPYEVTTVVTDIGRTSYQLAAEIRDPLSGEVFAAASSVLVCVDAGGQPQPVPASVRAALAP